MTVAFLWNKFLIGDDSKTFSIIMNLLFICRFNQMRSRTAEALYSDGLYKSKSAGTAYNAKVKISCELIQWADIIFTMDEKQARYILRKFQCETGEKPVVSLNIPDCYYYMEPELVAILRIRISPYLK